MERARLVDTGPGGKEPARGGPGAVGSGQRGLALVAAQRAAWGAKESTPIILLPGRLTRWKGQLVLLEALARLPDAAGVLVGAGEAFAAELRARAAALGLGNRLVLAGHVEAMDVALAAADVVVHASTDAEAFGRTVIEAQAMARPVVAADLGGPRETVEHGVTGWLVPPGDPAALADALARVLAMPAPERDAIGETARAAVLRHFTTAAMQRATVQLYRELLP
ncbi:glycosyltransferase [Leptolyngbya sp. 15MV]|nr:glycosyltransferase [Leptolyngbya sp. 15MV]